MKHLAIILQLICFCFVALSHGQGKEFKMPSLDDGKNTVDLKFTADQTYPEVKTTYMVGTIEDTLRYSVKNIGFDLLPFKVMVISPNLEQDIKVILVKNHWKDVAKTKRTNDGLFQDEFRTAGQFGIMLVGGKPNVPFRLAVYHGGVVKKTSPIFIAAADFKAGNTNFSNTDNAFDTTANELTDGKGGSPALWIIAIVLVLIFGLLLYFIVVKKAKNKALLMLLLSTTTLLMAGGYPSNRAAFLNGAKSMSETLLDVLGQANDVADFAEKMSEGARDSGVFDNLTGSDRNFEPDMDPRGQPQLPSSCLSASPTSRPDSNRNSNRNQNSGREESEDYPDNTAVNDGTSSSPASSTMKPAEVFDDPFVDNGTTSGPNLRTPKYDKNGNLIDAGDYPDTPTKVPTHPVTGEPILPVFAGRNTIGSDNPVPPKYDKNGYLVSAGDYPNSPSTVPIDPDTGEIMPPVFADNGVQSQSNSPRQPKYDKNGNLVDPGDYPDAPTKVGIDSETGEPIPPVFTGEMTVGRSEEGLEPKDDKEDLSTRNGENFDGSSTDGQNSSNLNTNNRNRSDGDDEDNSEGCQCLKKAYEDLEETRYKFEKLAVILNITSEDVSASLALGDNVSGIHAISGMAWQNERVKIVKSYEEFREAYDSRYAQLVEELYTSLMEVEKCELKLGFENWYSIAGFMYYEFAKARFHRNGR